MLSGNEWSWFPAPPNRCNNECWLVVWNRFYFPFHIWDNSSHWLSYFSRWLSHHQPDLIRYAHRNHGLVFQWEFQDPKMEVLYHIRPYFVGIFPSNLGSWNGHVSYWSYALDGIWMGPEEFPWHSCQPYSHSATQRRAEPQETMSWKCGCVWKCLVYQ
jgi:hypothetical protein